MGVSGGEDGYVIEGVGIMGESFEGRVMRVVKDGIEEHGMGFELCTICYETSIFISFLDYWQVTFTWSPYGDASLICSFIYW